MPRQPKLDSARTLHHVMTRGIEQRRIVDDAKQKVGMEEVKGGSRWARMPGIRSELAVRLMEECGLSLAEIGRWGLPALRFPRR